MDEPVPTDLEHVVCLPFSSGTTGLSKGVKLTHRCMVANLVQNEPVVPMSEDEAKLSFLPFFHIYGMQVLMNATLAVGGTVVTMPRFDLEMFLTLAHKLQVTEVEIMQAQNSNAAPELVEKFNALIRRLSGKIRQNA